MSEVKFTGGKKSDGSAVHRCVGVKLARVSNFFLTSKFDLLLKDPIYICLEPEAQDHSSTFKVFNLGSN